MPTPLGSFLRVPHKGGIPVAPFRLQITSPNGKPFLTLMIECHTCTTYPLNISLNIINSNACNRWQD
jgi:hypothetical protein